MSNLKLKLLVATSAVSVFAGAVTAAPVVLPAAELRGTGASAVADITTRTMNCVGGYNDLGLNTPGFQAIPEGLYSPTTPTATNPPLNCATQDIQPNVQGKYVSSGSGFGRQQWRRNTTQFTDSPNNNNPFVTPDSLWPNVQFAFSEAPTSASEETEWNTNWGATAKKPIAVPFFTVPVAFGYNPRYGILNTGSGDVSLNFFLPTTPAIANPNGGLRLSKKAYCAIVNGVVVNFNTSKAALNPALLAADLSLLEKLNGNKSFKDANDPQARWDAEGVPIRLVGRWDRSGTTDVFTRHMAAVCPAALAAYPANTNKFLNNAESLPFDNTSPINMTVYGSNTRYQTGQAPSNFAGTQQSISGAYWDTVTQSILTGQGNEAPGLFMVANGNPGVEEAVRFEGSSLKTSTFDPTVKLNGKLGYVAGDWVKPTPGRSLNAAALQKGLTAAYAMPTALNAGQAFGAGTSAIYPPQTTAASGAFNVNDARLSFTSSGNTVSRARLRDWFDVLYSGSPSSLANPTGGYPITGVSVIHLYTCYATNANRWAIAHYVGAMFGKVTKKSDGTSLNANTFKGTGAASLGIATQSNIGFVPTSWQGAITETFLKSSAQTSTFTSGPFNGTNVPLKTLNFDPLTPNVPGNGLWIQSKIPFSSTDIDGIGTLPTQEALPNSACVAGQGA
jgi:hypothetical protein